MAFRLKLQHVLFALLVLVSLALASGANWVD